MSRVQVMFPGKSRTKQSFKAECDINRIMKRFKKTAGAEFLDMCDSPSGGVYGDFTGISDYQSALAQVKQAEASFEALPWQLRKRFDHDPGAFLDFVLDPKNSEELKKMGLAKPVEAQKVVETKVETK
ncbi:MAG: internal scaffolding protein [Arizlama microvirus]|nr:MAG: internal scaffolding protein [Arizlama microvirus]